MISKGNSIYSKASPLSYSSAVRALGIVIAVTTVMLPGGAFGQNGNPNPGVHPINSKPYGQSYGEWSAKWWQWVLAAPTLVNPNLDVDGSHCGEGQSGHVWFLGGSFGTLPPFVTRRCTVPPGKSLFMPAPLGFGATTLNGAGAGECQTPVIAPASCAAYQFVSPTGVVLTGVPALHAVAKATIDGANLSAPPVFLDGKLLRELSTYRAASPAFSFILPADNVPASVFGIPDTAGTYSPAVSDGYWLMFEPLSAGTHTIGPCPPIGPCQPGIMYEITVQR